jgi:phage baseplate assembly protein W
MTSLYKKITLRTAPSIDIPVSKMYKGFSTISPDAENFGLYDFQLVKQDLINHFNIRQGEKLMNPNFGCIIWDLLFEPLTEQLKSIIIQNVNNIINYDPRIEAQQVLVTQYESGIQIECTLRYLPYNMTETMALRFDQDNGILTK